jgi:hypothetical protein
VAAAAGTRIVHLQTDPRKEATGGLCRPVQTSIGHQCSARPLNLHGRSINLHRLPVSSKIRHPAGNFRDSLGLGLRQCLDPHLPLLQCRVPIRLCSPYSRRLIKTVRTYRSPPRREPHDKRLTGLCVAVQEVDSSVKRSFARPS